jgi:hypothetical protein
VQRGAANDRDGGTLFEDRRGVPAAATHHPLGPRGVAADPGVLWRPDKSRAADNSLFQSLTLSSKGMSMWRQLGASSRLLLWAAFLACFGFVLAVVLNLVRFEPTTYELASPTSRPHQPSR